ncbi:MAG TPA: TaqI-like C-terminal specificity domain-containing protein [Phycisphaerae bacterium]|nr:TaqI-like C-terminal specificity domain-containing protein [Phycisphaerae bacterium]
MATPQQIESALQRVRDQKTFVQELLAGALDWPIAQKVESLGDIAFDWSESELRAQGLSKHLVAGQISQIQPLRADQPWGVFILEFKNADVFNTGRGMTGPLRQVLRGLVPSRRRDAGLAVWKRENLLFICTHDYKHYRFAYFKAPLGETKTAPLAAFGWNPDEPVRTACEWNLPALTWPESKTSADEWIARWAGAFDVEKVTREFYEDYERVFKQVESLIGKHTALDDDSLRLFTQSLFNRLMFLRFIERKTGWLTFGTSRHFLSELFKAGGLAKRTFYRTRLRPLFFEGLAKEHAKSDVYGDVPFLNGGLFEEGDLDKKVTDLPDHVFAPILDQSGLFYRYNFTVEESTPLDIEVAVDPEMLGKVFERLVTRRHESGSYYTPRPIVSFMCREALKGYLQSVVKAPESAITALVDNHEVAGLSESHARAIITALDDLKAVDPACGSGAYLLGLLHEVAVLYRLLYSEKLLRDSRSLYDLKLRIISHNLYGVDIDPFATSIAMLRLWLSLAVDSDDPVPLPNLEYKIETGDSICGPDPQGTRDAFGSGEMFEARLASIADDLVELKDRFLKSHGAEKTELKKIIQKQETDIAHELRLLRLKDEVIWRVQFAEAFSKGGGFHIVLANPPYIRQELIKELKPKLENLYECFDGRADFYVYFYERGVKLLQKGGVLSFISSNKFFRAGYGKPLRAFMSQQTELRQIIDFNDLPIFAATAYPCIVIARRQSPVSAHTVATLNVYTEDELGRFAQLAASQIVPMAQNDFGSGVWRLQAPDILALLTKIRSAGTLLGELLDDQIYAGIKTGLNEAFIIDGDTRARLLRSDPRCKEIIKPFIKGKDIGKWLPETGDRFIIYTPHGIKIDHYPAIKEHLRAFKSDLEERALDQKWYELQQPQLAFVERFEEQKIIYPNVSLGCRFAIDTNSYLDMTSFCIRSSDLALLAILNSSLMTFFFSHLGIQRRGGYQEFKTQYVRELPIALPAAAQRRAMEGLVTCVLWLNRYAREQRNAETNRDQLMRAYLERILNGLVYELYFKDELVRAGLRLFDIVSNAKVPELNAIPEDDRIRQLRAYFESIQGGGHPLRIALDRLQTLDTVRVIEGNA